MDSFKRIAHQIQKIIDPREKILKADEIGPIHIQEILKSQLHKAASEYIETQLNLYELSEHPVTYDHIVKVRTIGPVETYAVTYTSPDYQTFSKGKGLIVTDIFNNSRIGEGRVWLSMEEEGSLYKDQPFVEWSSTEENFKRKGLALRRLHIMNRLCVQYLGHPLRSSYLISGDAKAVWKKLHAQGEVDEIPLGFFSGEPGNPADIVYRFRE